MLVECTVHIGGADLITIRLLASPVQSFLWKAVDFSLAFLSSSISTYRISQSRPYRVYQTWLLRKLQIQSQGGSVRAEPPQSRFSWLSALWPSHSQPETPPPPPSAVIHDYTPFFLQKKKSPNPVAVFWNVGTSLGKWLSYAEANWVLRLTATFYHENLARREQWV